MKLLIFLGIPFSIKAVSLERALIGVSLMIFLTIQTFECVRIWFSLFIFKSRRVSFQIRFATPSEVMIVLRFVRAIAFDAPRTLYSVRKSSMTPLLTIFALGYSWVHVCTPNSCYVNSNIETSIDKIFCSTFILNIPDIEPNDRHV